MKIIMPAANFFWTTKMECMKAYQRNIILLQFDTTDNNENITTIDVRPDFYGLGQDNGIGRESRSYFIVKKHIQEIIEKFDDQEDVLVLADTNPQNIYIFDILKRFTDGKIFKLHFWGIFPFRFESRWRKMQYQELLSGDGRIKSLYIKKIDEYTENISKTITMPQFLKRIQADLAEQFPHIVREILTFEVNKNYFFDHKSGRYIEAELSGKKWMRKDFSDEKERIGETKSYRFAPFSEEKELIQQLSIRSDGKEICRQLRKLRNKFSKANNIQFVSEDCGFEGACAGTCEKCDSELLSLYEKLRNLKEGSTSYPYYEILDCGQKHNRNCAADITSEYLKKHEKINNNIPPKVTTDLVETPIFLKNSNTKEKKRMNEIMGISRLRMGTDGNGITTLVAFYGCPLYCAYCLNPQCKRKDTIRAEYDVDELLSIIEIDDIYFRMTGGGVTFGGGEPLLNSVYIRKFCDKANSKWKIRVETSLNVPWESVELLVSYIDLWIVDIKDMNPDIYRQYTQRENQQVMDNLYKLKMSVGVEKIMVRIPLIPDYNMNHDIENSVQKLEGFTNIDRFTYHI